MSSSNLDSNSNSDTDDDNINNNNEMTNEQQPRVSSIHNHNVSPPPPPRQLPAPIVCLQQFAGDSIAGGVMGSIFGLGVGLFKKKGLTGSFGDAASNAKTFAVLSGVHSLVVCALKRLRGKDDIINSGVAGCCTGLALSFPGAPQVLLQSCLTFGAFSFIMDGLNKHQTAMAQTISMTDFSGHRSGPLPLALPLSVALPEEMKEAFSSFCKSLKKPKKLTFPK
ncbi:hypothetical protein ACFE04_006024 [Oxalis oulophora]